MSHEAPPCRPTSAHPGTELKVAVLAARYEAGESLWNPRDATREDLIVGAAEGLGGLLGEDWDDEEAISD